MFKVDVVTAIFLQENNKYTKFTPVKSHGYIL